MTTPTTLVCLFHHADEAHAAVNDLLRAGVPESSIRLIGEGNVGADALERAELACIGMPDYDYDHLKLGIQDGGLVLSVAATGSEIATVEAIFGEHAAQFLDEAEKAQDSTPRDCDQHGFKPGTT